MTLLPDTFPVTCHTNHIAPGGTFVAVPGYTRHGAQYVADAIKKGATTVVLEKNDAGMYDQLCAHGLVDGVQYVLVPCARRALAERAAIAAGNPAQKLTIIGVTGTKGKTTTTSLTASMLKAEGRKVATLGTVQNCIDDHCMPSALTTPLSDQLHQFFAQCVAEHITHVVMEVSAHALSLHRVHGIEFAHVVFTNISPEHQDFFGTLPRYLEAKKKIFAHCGPSGMAHMLAGALADQVADALPKNTRLVANDGSQPATSNDISYELLDDAFDRLVLCARQGDKRIELVSRQPGTFNATNIMLAASVARACGVGWQTIQSMLEGWRGVPGRLEMHTTKRGVKVLIDYAHDPLSVDTVLSWVREYTEHLTVVLGCGGDRDTTKRAPMGAAAAHYADVLVLTSDNPRTEDPLAIIEQIQVGVQSEHNKDEAMAVVVEPDRKKAIERACQELSHPDGVVAILGRGHETVQLVGTTQVPLSDVGVVEKMC